MITSSLLEAIVFQVHEVESVECGWGVKDPYNEK